MADGIKQMDEQLHEHARMILARCGKMVDSADNQELQSKLSAANTNLASKTIEIGNLQDKLKVVNKDLTSKVGEVIDLQSKLNAANINLASKATEIESLQDKLKVVNKDLSSKVGEVIDLQSKLNAANVDLASKATEIGNLQDKLKVVNKDLASKLNEVTELQNKLDIANEKIDELDDKLFEIATKNIETLGAIASSSHDRLKHLAYKKIQEKCQLADSQTKCEAHKVEIKEGNKVSYLCCETKDFLYNFLGLDDNSEIDIY